MQEWAQETNSDWRAECKKLTMRNKQGNLQDECNEPKNPEDELIHCGNIVDSAFKQKLETVLALV